MSQPNIIQVTHIEDFSTTPLPPADRFHEEIGSLTSDIRPFSEDLYEQEYFLEKRWLQIEEKSPHSRLHIFRNGGEYLESIDGNILTGTWSILENSNTLILEKASNNGRSDRILYDLSFLNEDFFILKKHGSRLNFETQFILLGREAIVAGMEWEEVLNLIESRYQNNKKLVRAIMLVIALIILYIIFTQT